MGLSWVKTNYPDVVYREHKKKTHNGQPDRYFVIRYRKQGKRKAEAAGWWSKGMNPQKASRLRDVITENIRIGRRPQSIKEMREIDQEQQEIKERKRKKEESENLSFGVVAEDYIDWLKNNKKSAKANVSRYNNHIKPVFAEVPMREITPLSLERFKRELQRKELSPKTIHHCLTFIRTVYKKAITWGYYNGTIPTTQIDFPKINNSRLRFLSHDEAVKLLNALAERSTQTHDQALLALHCGLRSDEVRNLRWGNFDFKQGIIYLPETKAGEAQQAFMTEDVKNMLLDRLPDGNKPSDYVFPGKVGQKQYKISDTFKRTVEDLKLNEGIDNKDRRQRVVFHSLRHTFCSWLAIQGTPLYTIKELARHKSISQTERYSHLCPDTKQNAIKEMAKTFKRKKKLSAEGIKKVKSGKRR